MKIQEEQQDFISDINDNCSSCSDGRPIIKQRAGIEISIPQNFMFFPQSPNITAGIRNSEKMNSENKLEYCARTIKLPPLALFGRFFRSCSAETDRVQ